MIKPGSIVYGKITNILGYGAFVAIEGYDGLIHISEFSDNFVRNIEDYVKVGDRIKLKVLEVDEEHKQLKLSYRQLHKTRGVRCRVPQYQIGFQPLKENLNHWIEVSKEGKNE